MPTYRDPETGIAFRSETDLAPDEIAAGFAVAAQRHAEPSVRARAADYVRAARPGLQAGGAMAGGTVGLSGGPGGAMLGAGLGFAGAGQLADAVEKMLRGGPVFGAPTAATGQEALGAATDVLTGAAGEGLGQAVSRGAGALAGRMRAARAARFPEREAVVAAAQRQRIPLAGSDVSQSVTARRLENAPNYFAIGGGKVQAFREGQVAATEGAARRVVDELAQGQADTLTAGLQAQGGARTALREFRRQSGELFERINTLAGDQPIVPTANLRGVAESLVRAGAKGADDAVRPATKLSQVYGLSDETAAALEHATTTEAIPFAVARQLEAELGDLAFRGPRIAGPRAGQLKALYSAVRQDLDAFLQSPGGDELAPALAEAKQVYSTGKQLFNDSAKRLILGSRNAPLAPETVGTRVFRPGQIEPTIEFKLLVDDQTYAQATQAWLDGVLDQATVQGRFSPAKFATLMQKYERNGHLDVILPPPQAQAVRDIAGVASAMTRAERLAHNPSGTAQGVVTAGQLMTPVGLLATGNVPAAGGHLAANLLLPKLLAEGVLSGPGRRLVGDGMPGVLDLLGPQTLRTVSQSLAAETQ